jgi:hypothetical protein
MGKTPLPPILLDKAPNHKVQSYRIIQASFV